MSDVNSKPQPPAGAGYVKPLLFSILTLASGVIIGVMATIILRPKPPQPDEKGWEYVSKRTVNMMVRELKLTPEQKEQIKPIVRKHFKNIDAIRKEVRTDIREEFEEMNDDLMDVYNDQQQTRWKHHIEKMKKHFPGMHQRRGPGGQGPRGPGQGQRGPGQGQRRPGGQGQWGPGQGQRGQGPWGQDQRGPGRGMQPGQFPRLERWRIRPPRDPNQPPLPKKPQPLPEPEQPQVFPLPPEQPI